MQENRTNVSVLFFFFCSGLVDPAVVVEQSGRMSDANDGDGTFRSFLHRHPRRYVSKCCCCQCYSILCLCLTKQSIIVLGHNLPNCVVVFFGCDENTTTRIFWTNNFLDSHLFCQFCFVFHFICFSPKLENFHLRRPRY